MKKFLIRGSIVIIFSVAVALGIYWYTQAHQDVLLEKAFDVAEDNIDKLDLTPHVRDDVHVFTKMARSIFVVDDVTRRYLVLLQNDMELRPGGGFLGQYATVEIFNGRIVTWEIADANHLDNVIHSDIKAPPSFLRWLNIKNLEFRDSNWELDFPTNAQVAMHLYNLGSTPQDFDGVLAFNASILNDILAVTGPVIVDGYEEEGAFTEENALTHLEDIVERPVLLFKMKQKCKKRRKEMGTKEVCNIDPDTGKKIKNLSEADKVYRKAVLPLLAEKVIKTLFGEHDDALRARFDLAKKNVPAILTLAVRNFEDRDLQLWFVDEELQKIVDAQNWGTRVDTDWTGDYLAVVDANLGALKSDYYIKRELAYTVDFTGSNAEQNDVSQGRMVRYPNERIKEQVMAGTFRTIKPLATMRMTYEHTAEKANYRTSDYHAYTRLYTPAGTQWWTREWFFAPTTEETVYGNKQAFAYKFDIFIGDTLPTMLQYTLPETITEDGYTLKIQKQSGIGTLPVTMKIIDKSGTEYTEKFDVMRDVIVRLVGEGAERKLEVEYL